MEVMCHQSGIEAGSFLIGLGAALLFGALTLYSLPSVNGRGEGKNQVVLSHLDDHVSGTAAEPQCDGDGGEPQPPNTCSYSPIVKNIRNTCGKKSDVSDVMDEQILKGTKAEQIQARNLNTDLSDFKRAVVKRRKLLQKRATMAKAYDCSKVLGICFENMVGFVRIPIGVAGPLFMNGQKFRVPMATTNGCLVASTNLGCRATYLSNGISTRITFDGMSLDAVVRLPSGAQSCEVLSWINDSVNFAKLKKDFDATSQFMRLKSVKGRIAGRCLFLQFVAVTGDAIGTEKISKGTELALETLQNEFKEMEILSLNGNYRTDNKPTALNWVESRGKSVVAEATIPAKLVKQVLKTTTKAIVELNIAINGSYMAGSIGGNNSHAASVVAAIFIATGQNPAHNVCSSNCITLMEPAGDDGLDLHISCTMPSIQVETVGRGTELPSQGACLELLGLKGPNMAEPGANAKMLASVVCATVLAGELSLMSALAAGHPDKFHSKCNRSNASADKAPNSAPVQTSPSNVSAKSHPEHN